jgi:hypothetical protein
LGRTVRLRYLETGSRTARYESVYTVLTHPREPLALWIRTTVRKVPHAPAAGAVWVTWFGEHGVRAAKLTDLPVVPGGHGIRVGAVTQGPGGSSGSIALPRLSGHWDMTFSPRAAPLDHLTPAALYSAPFPKTKSSSPVPDLDVTGDLVIDGSRVDLNGWTGMLGQNWGSEHAAQWAWLRASGLGPDESGWLDAVLGRVRVGPMQTPWTGFGVLALDGERIRLGGLLNRRSDVHVRADGADITLAGRDIRVNVRATTDLDRTVGWEYADPTGGRHEVVNSSVARMTLHVDRHRRTVELAPVRRGVLELGGDHRALDVPLQPFPD